MTKEEFLRQLAYELRALSKEERDSAMQYYRDYLNDADDVDAALNNLGSPQRVAADILREVGGTPQTQQKPAGKRRLRDRWNAMDNNQRILILLLLAVAAVCVFPVCIGLGGGALGILIAAVAVVFAFFLVFLCLAFGFAIASVFCLFAIPFAATSAAHAVVLLGCVLTFGALAYLCYLAFVFCIRTIFRL